MERTRRCTRCKIVKPVSEFYIRKRGRDIGRPMQPCRPCARIRHNEQSYRLGYCRPLSQVTDCGAYLGCFIAERALSKFFDNIQRMPNNTRGYDFICGKGYKIDCKSSCLHVPKHGNSTSWAFRTYCNQIADYFLCLAFNNREELEPQHVWLIPSEVMGRRTGLTIMNSLNGLKKWANYEKPLDKVIYCCNKIKEMA